MTVAALVDEPVATQWYDPKVTVLHVVAVKKAESAAGAHLLFYHEQRVEIFLFIFGRVVHNAWVVMSAQVLSTHVVPSNLQYYVSHKLANPVASEQDLSSKA